MQKLVLLILGGSVAVGALMPADPTAQRPASPAGARIGTAPPLLTVEPGLEQDQSQQARHVVQTGTGAVTLERAGDGHFYAEAQVNGMPIRFLIDTGATGIALTREDAQRAQVQLDPRMDEIVGTGASGDVKGQFVTLDRVSLGPKDVQGVDAAVLSGGRQSLLGQSFLAEFGSVSIEGDRMVLR
ncbi:TIGR02281 family clan AA aspartic protease [Sphingomonas piscis]|uniref:TIGR02281 family clan AA aspartic protease n=1 Tax=Sphingomonas piscis TaxID=2714943 RepID=A0A6G7YPY3_9SPHN|nr:TIGR02281 family clan AA aspartic protease [Sphingomonas piscis]QIK78808.1 TIGR02281 family clan AA aspartic protease [Sphingomonas piscis]